ncbi:Bax inhibitor-1/YccA family protein [Arsenicicoccus dermatophilus]|uniref:Bax inhibitor-1/YccA family protein n=1 Tax=Arsenicicoccus dermatophilus TaxID=1076331 RepID=UPI001F4D246B|nr:Bax inhibitor-1/YccA family protein [Arsenicicoccus dermatophilus]MCH8612146.1 Bax inhibitor-1/YccA family protein [Arsenicicoccus dermatophilus]
MSNPIFDRVDRESRGGYPQRDLSAGQLQDMYAAPSVTPPHERRLTLDDVLMKALLLLGIVVVVGAVSWFASATVPGVGGTLWLAGMIGTLVLGLVIAFKKAVSVPLIVGYAVLEGIFVGAVSQAFERMYDGAVPSAIVATLCVFGAMFAGWKLGFIKVTDKFRRMMGMALLGYAIFALVNLVAALMGVGAGWGFGGSGALGIGISLFATGLAAFTLALDFDSIDNAVRSGMPEKYSWLLAHGLVVTVVWLYIELLRLIGRFRD